MITIKINENERLLKDIDEQWINQQINRRRDNGEIVYVWITIHQNNIDICLMTPPRQYSGGSSKVLTAQEKEIVALWNKLGCDNQNFSSGNIIAFLKHFDNHF